MIHGLARCAIFAAVVCTVGVAADNPGATMYSFGSFGTLGVVHSDEKRADFASTNFKPDGDGYSHNWSADVDSLIAAQLTANVSPEISAVVQVISEQNNNNSFAPHLVGNATNTVQFTISQSDVEFSGSGGGDDIKLDDIKLDDIKPKVQFDHTRMRKDSAGTLINLQPGFQPGGDVNVASATIDFVL